MPVPSKDFPGQVISFQDINGLLEGSAAGKALSRVPGK